MILVEDFQRDAAEWLTANAAHAPRDYGAISTGLSEPGVGSDLGSLATRAERDGDRYVVNGQKVWCSGGRSSNWGILMERTRPGSEFDEVFFTEKLGITEMMFEVAMLRGDVAGANALLDGADALGMLAAPGGRIAGGTSQVQRNIIGEHLLGLPREPKHAP